MAYTDRRPVYVLGAGFSKAIASAMPVTDELGAAVAERLDGIVELRALASGVSFEDWLTLHVTRLPFLQGYENTKRAAEAQRVVAEIALILDEEIERATASAAPDWLLGLLRVWSVERATIITFNYDNLLERAVNGAYLLTHHELSTRVLFAEEVVYPAPPPPPAITYSDMSAPDEKSFQLLKLHGSVNWYWSAGDPTGTTLTRTRERGTFGSGSLVSFDEDFTGARTLDRFLVPPVLSKADFYTSYLTNALWRTARVAVENAAALTLIGYSLPAGDRVTSELLAGVQDDVSVTVVDRAPGNPEDVGSLAGRVSRLSRQAPTLFEGLESVENYARACMTLKVSDLGRLLGELIRDSPDASVLAAAHVGTGLNAEGRFFALWDRGDQLTLAEVDSHQIRHSERSPLELAFAKLPSGTARYEDLLDPARVQGRASAGLRIAFEGDEWIAFHAELQRVGRWNVIILALSQQ